jgi:para-aminobenzoate synthetase component 1
MLNWAKQFNIFCFLDSQQYAVEPGGQECILAAGARWSVEGESLPDLDAFRKAHAGWAFGHLSYALGERLLGITGAPPDPIGFAPYFFFVPEIIIQLKENELLITAPEPKAILRAVEETPAAAPASSEPLQLEAELGREDYIQIIEALKEHIQRGDCYEINFCQAYSASGVRADPFQLFSRLMDVSPNPFSALYRQGDRYLLCASPERFLKKTGSRILSQPIKGTSPRHLTDPLADEESRRALRASAKEQAENVMVVDLVRNDLSRICLAGSVEVEELFGVYSYPQVHQLISTVSGELVNGLPLSAILEATFPMGSMTGAPKKRVMELIRRYEQQARGIFSGAVGYFSPEDDFDFNVVIRSLMYNDKTGHLSYQVGSGITIYSHPAAEWEECELKAAAIKKVLAG